MNFLSIKAALESDLNAWWPAAGNTPIAWENVPFNDNGGLYIVPEVTPAISFKLDYGRQGTAQINGTFNIRIVAPVNQGAGAAIGKANLLINHFGDTVISGVHLDVGSLNIIGTVENRYQINVAIPFWTYQEARA